jgi:ribosomal protein S18 acetylase RimI-like enzyme
MNDINAAIGLANLEHVENNIFKIKTIANFYNKELSSVQGVELLETAYGASPSYWIYTIKIVDKYNFIKFMKERGVICSQVHNRNDGHSCVKMYKTNLPQLDILEKSIVCIPCGWWVEMPTAQTIVSYIKEWCKKKTPVIREITINDYHNNFLQVLCQLNRQIYNNYSKEMFGQKLNIFKQLGHYIYVAEIRDDNGHSKVVGTVKLIIEPKFYDSVGHIEDVVVDKYYNGLHIGKSLVKHVTQIAFEKYNCYKVVLNASKNVEKFYEKCEYELEEYSTSYTFRLQKMKQNI